MTMLPRCSGRVRGQRVRACQGCCPGATIHRAMGKAYYYNVRGTSARKCGCGSWIDHYYNNSDPGDGGHKCAVLGCGSKSEVGAHVATSDGRSDKCHYIVPMCKWCNGQDDTEFQFKSHIRPVTANKKYAGCG